MQSCLIIQQALAINAIVAIEDLSEIRERTNQMPRTKTERRGSNSWAFYQLRQFLDEKAIGASLEVRYQSPLHESNLQ